MKQLDKQGDRSMLCESHWKMFILSFILIIVNLHPLAGEDKEYHLPKPVLSLNPTYRVLFQGENVTLTCHCQCSFTLHRYYRHQEYFVEQKTRQGQCNSSIPLRRAEGYEARYTCECLHHENHIWSTSERSDPVQIVVGDQLSQPTILTSPDSGAVVNGENAGISCKGDIRSNGGKVHLYKNRSGSPIQSRVVKGNVQSVYFSINSVKEGTGGNYSCRYETMVLRHWKKSPFSKDVTITVTAAPSTPWLNIALWCAAFIVVLPCVALALVLIVKRGRKRKHYLRRREASTGGDMGYQDANDTYGTANVSPNSDTMDVHPEAPPEDRQELTYATLNLEALKQKEAASATTGDCSIYSEVKKK